MRARALPSPPMARSFDLLRQTLKRAAHATAARSLEAERAQHQSRNLRYLIPAPVPIRDPQPLVLSMYLDENPDVTHVYRSTTLLEPLYHAEFRPKSRSVVVREPGPSGGWVGTAHVDSADDEIRLCLAPAAEEDGEDCEEFVEYFWEELRGRRGGFVCEFPAGPGVFYWTRLANDDLVLLDANGVVLVRWRNSKNCSGGQLGRCIVYGCLKWNEHWVETMLLSVLAVLRKSQLGMSTDTDSGYSTDSGDGTDSGDRSPIGMGMDIDSGYSSDSGESSD